MELRLFDMAEIVTLGQLFVKFMKHPKRFAFSRNCDISLQYIDNITIRSSKIILEVEFHI